MFRYLKAIWYYITGRAEKARKAWMLNEHVMSATYDAAIKKSENNFEVTKNAVSEMVVVEQGLVASIKVQGEKIERLNKVKEGAKVAMQRRINELKGTHTQEQIKTDSDFIKHQLAYDDASKSLAEATTQYDELNVQLGERRKLIATYKAQLQQHQRGVDKLRAEKHDALADVALAKQSEAINATLANISGLTTDEELKDAREARQRARASASVVSEITGNDARAAEQEYVNYASQSASANELDSLLDWGNESDDKDRSPAKLPE